MTADTVSSLALDEAMQALLTPVPGPDPCGDSLRADSLFTDIRLAREEDDPNLPMRQWERPLHRADWRQIDAWCTEALTTRSKNLQLAAWLTEAWIRQEGGVAALARGLLLVRELVGRYWEGLHPRLDPPEEGGDCEARVAPFDWMGDSLANTLRVHVTLFPLAQRKPARVSLADWERLVASELAQAQDAGDAADLAQGHADEPPLTREEIVANVARHAPQAVADRLRDVREARAHLVALVETLAERLGPHAPVLRKLAAVLDTLERVLLQVQASIPPAREAGSAAANAAPLETNADAMPFEPNGDPTAPNVAPHVALSPVVTGAWPNRDEAYRTLEALAEYLAAIEPHSPTPYLIRRAVNWGRLPLPALMAEIMQEEGDLNRMVQLLGLNK
jgi:type VI secretion system protein ImpA